MQGQDAKRSERDAECKPTDDLELRHVKPGKLIIGAGEREVKIYANGLFEENDEGDIVPKRDLEAGIMTEDGDEIDNIIIVGRISSDDFDYQNCFVRVKITVPVHPSIDEGYRSVFIKHKNEKLDENGECHSDTCDVLKKGVNLEKK